MRDVKSYCPLPQDPIKLPNTCSANGGVLGDLTRYSLIPYTLLWLVKHFMCNDKSEWISEGMAKSQCNLSTRLLTSCCGVLSLFTQHCVWTEGRVNVPLLQIFKDITVCDECFSPLALQGTNVAVQRDKEGWNCSTLCGHLMENLFHLVCT